MFLERITSVGLSHNSWFVADGGEAAVVDPRRDFDVYLSSNRTCEVGLERATGKAYRSPILLMEELTR